MRIAWVIALVGCSADTISVLDLDEDVGVVTLDVQRGHVDAMVNDHRIGLDPVSWGRRIDRQHR